MEKTEREVAAPNKVTDYPSQLSINHIACVQTFPSGPKGFRCKVIISNDSDLTKQWDNLEAMNSLSKGYRTGLSDTFYRACRSLKLKLEEHCLYRKWLIKTGVNQYGGQLTENDLPIEKNELGFIPKLPPHYFLPYPTGSMWRKMKDDWGTNTDEDVLNMMISAQTEALHAHLIKQKVEWRESKRVNLAVALDQTVRVMHANQASTTRKPKKKKRQKASLHGRRIPQSVMEALASTKPLAWIKAMNNEIEGLIELEVVQPKLTKAKLLEMGITSPPVPLGLYFDEKLNALGELEKEKARAAIQGHSGNMFKGTHHMETFSATPQEESIRVIAALIVLLNLRRGAYDIEKAYTWATIRPEERIALKYLDGFKEVNEEGEELFMALLKNLYGNPGAARRFTKQRDERFISDFSKAGWQIKRLYMDPCFFYLVKDSERAFCIIHSDDIKIAGESDKIMSEFEIQAKKIWTLKKTDPSWILGLEEVTQVDDQGIIINVIHKMPTFVTGMGEAFQQYLPKEIARGPYPEKSSLNKDNYGAESEAADIIDRGYQRAVGMLIWSIRKVFDEQRYGMAIISSLMAKPCEEAWKTVMFMIKWQVQNADRGVQWHRDGNKKPYGFSDASNKLIVPSLGTCQAGCILSWLNGPICSISQRLHHVGLSSEHNAYMGINLLAKKIVWFRQLLGEIDMGLTDPIPVYADNVQANKLCMEDFISSGNQYILTQYHFNKERVQMGHMEIFWLRTTENPADQHTKATDYQTAKRLIPFVTGWHDGFDEAIDISRMI